jgi:cellobiose transport system permease protein
MTITIYLYNLGWGQLNFGRAAAVAWLLFLIIVLIGLLNLAITRRIAASSETPSDRKPRRLQRRNAKKVAA